MTERNYFSYITNYNELFLLYKFTRFFIYFLFLSDEGPMLETLDYTIRIGSIPTFLYFDLYLYSAYAAHFVYIYIYAHYAHYPCGSLSTLGPCALPALWMWSLPLLSHMR